LQEYNPYLLAWRVGRKGAAFNAVDYFAELDGLNFARV
jgi:hypothetical protein